MVARIGEHDSDIGECWLNQDGRDITCGERRFRRDQVVDLYNARRG